MNTANRFLCLVLAMVLAFGGILLIVAKEEWSSPPMWETVAVLVGLWLGAVAVREPDLW